MITAVLDTNVLAAGTVTAGNPPGQILNAWRDGQFELITSIHIIDELKHTFQKPYFQGNLSIGAISNFVDLLVNEAAITSINVIVQGVATHPEDDLALAAAITAKADYFVTGDGPLLRKVGNSYQGVNLVTPNDFLKILQRQN